MNLYSLLVAVVGAIVFLVVYHAIAARCESHAAGRIVEG